MCGCLYNLLTAIAPHFNQVGTPESDAEVDIGGNDGSPVCSQENTQYLTLSPNLDEALNDSDNFDSHDSQPFVFETSQE